MVLDSLATEASSLHKSGRVGRFQHRSSIVVEQLQPVQVTLTEGALPGVAPWTYDLVEVFPLSSRLDGAQLNSKDTSTAAMDLTTWSMSSSFYKSSTVRQRH